MRGAVHQNDHDDLYRMATDETEMKIKRFGTTALARIQVVRRLHPAQCCSSLET
jgi:hypothetical protein